MMEERSRWRGLEKWREVIGVLWVLLIAQNLVGAEPDSQNPLHISTNDIFIKVGENYTAHLYPTSSFNMTFRNETESVLVFKYSQPDIVQVLPNVTLVKGHQIVFKNTSVIIFSKNAGRVIIKSVLEPPDSRISVENIFLRVSAYKIAVLLLLSDIVGWIYFAAWSVSFYPQIFQNWQRKSVRGLSLDFVFINITGFAVYGIYNIGLFWVPSMQDQYFDKYPFGTIPVQLNDVIFTLHAVFASGILVTQCLIYDKGSQTVSTTFRTVLVGIYTFLFIMAIVALSSAVTWLTFLDTCSYVKLFVTLIKYIPQAYLNWSRKSTSGWCIGNVLLDFTGGIFSVMQMCIISYNHNDWASIFGDFAKFGLGLFSICFDIFFIIQHYGLYRNHDAYEPIDGTTQSEYVSRHEEMVTSNHVPSPDEEDAIIPASSPTSAY
jgi:LCT (Lysosomal Cystine Transporter) family transporter